ncbi:hypothetical protein FH972_023714 [Carpinus fangiana]|uniref:Thiamine phosphate synthase/TenI domain-containing protein n=1 Tax=Carpinus fangiana TaxID=176857 RepID=A0A5N6KWH3_9ROSI|nr:hypothetical protein FH972_023714 [Carpinus fangiana]
MAVDYSLYLVTDSTRQILGDADLVRVVDEAIKGGVTIVQYRDKQNDTRELIRVATQLHAVTRRHHVPLLINDRVDVALAVGCEGVHIGQDDMDLQLARKILGDKAIIGVTASSVDEAVAAVEAGADYLGLGTVFATPTKENTKSIIGTAGLRSILTSLATLSRSVPTVCIGGINADTIQRVVYQGSPKTKPLDGVAVVSAIVAARDPEQAARLLRRRLAEPPAFAAQINLTPSQDLGELLARVGSIAQRVAQQKPLCHNMTNLVVQNFAANVALAIGGSPIMSSNGLEARDLASLGGSLVLNMGTVTPESLKNYLLAMAAYNATGNPILFDPVGGGATSIRREAIATLMSSGYFDVIKGNTSEILTVLGEQRVAQRGVDSTPNSGFTAEDKARAVKRLAQRERNIVIMTGATDYISDGIRVFAISNGHEYLGSITGSGCTLGTTIAAFAAVERGDRLLAALAAILIYEIAAEQATQRHDVQGTGTFMAAFLDQLYAIRAQSLKGDFDWVAAAKVEHIHI